MIAAQAWWRCRFRQKVHSLIKNKLHPFLQNQWSIIMRKPMQTGTTFWYVAAVRRNTPIRHHIYCYCNQHTAHTIDLRNMKDWKLGLHHFSGTWHKSHVMRRFGSYFIIEWQSSCSCLETVVFGVFLGPQLYYLWTKMLWFEYQGGDTIRLWCMSGWLHPCEENKGVLLEYVVQIAVVDS